MKFIATCFAVPVAVLSLFLPVSALHAQSESDNSEPVTLVSHVDIQQDAGVIRYIVLQEIDATNHFTIIETWRSRKAYEMHEGAPHTVKFRDGIQPLLGSPFDSRMDHLFR